MKKIIILSVVLCSLAIVTVPSYATNLKQIQDTISKKEKENKELKEKSKQIVEEISSFKKNIIKSAQDIQKHEKELVASEQSLKALQEQRTQAQIELSSAYKNAGGLIKAAYRYQSSSQPMIFLQKDPVSAARAAMVMRSSLPKIQAQSEAYHAHLTETAKIEGDLSAQKEIVKNKINQISQKRDDLTKLIEQRKEDYQKTEQQRKQQEKELTALAKQAKDLKDLMRRVENKSDSTRLAGTTGLNKQSLLSPPPGMILPVSGTVATGFGQKDDMNAASDGVTFSVRNGAQVVAPIKGQVKFAGPFQKFGRVLIIEHANGYHSLIAGLGRIDTAVDAQLDAGEPIGTAPDTPGSQKIYYELRHKGDPINPQKAVLAIEQNTNRKRI